MPIAFRQFNCASRALDCLVRRAAHAEDLCCEASRAHAGIMPHIPPGEMAMMIVVVDADAVAGTHVAGLVVTEVEGDAPELMMCLQHIGRVAGSPCELHAETFALQGESFRGAQVARDGAACALSPDGGEEP